MDRIFLAVVASVLILIGTAAAQQTEESCKTQVNMAIAGIESMEQRTGQEQSMNGLTKKDIQEMLKTKTYCEVSQEISRRNQNQK